MFGRLVPGELLDRSDFSYFPVSEHLYFLAYAFSGTFGWWGMMLGCVLGFHTAKQDAASGRLYRVIACGLLNTWCTAVCNSGRDPFLPPRWLCPCPLHWLLLLWYMYIVKAPVGRCAVVDFGATSSQLHQSSSLLESEPGT